MMSSRRRLVPRASRLSCCLVLTLSVAACHGSAAPDSAGPAASASSNAPTHVRWPLEQAIDYKLEIATANNVGQSPVAVLLTLSASLGVTFRAFEGGTRAELELRDIRLLDHAKRPAEGAGQLTRELAQAFGFELADTGQLAAYYEEPNSSSYASGYRRQIAALFQTPPLEPGEAREWDATGLARIQYGKSPDPKARTWKRVEYERVLLGQSRTDDALDSTRIKPEIVSSEGTVQCDAQGLAELHRQEDLRADLTGAKNISTSVSVSLVRSAAPSSAGPARPQLFVAERRSPVDAPINPKRRINFDEVMIGGRTFPDVLAQYVKWAQAPGGIDGVPVTERATFFRALVGLLKKPETLILARRAVELNSAVRDTVVDALGMASTPDDSALLDELVFSAKSSKSLKVRAATALIRSPEPNEPGLAALERMISDETFQEHGLLGIGTYARLLREQNDPLADRAIARLRRELETAKSARVRALALLAIANSGANQLYELALAEQSSTTPDVRHSAIQAIRLMDDPRVEPRLVELLGSADVSNVQSALQALGRRETATESLVTRVQELARSHVAPTVRREAVLVLVKWREKWPSVEPVLKGIAEKDEDKRVREAARGKAT